MKGLLAMERRLQDLERKFENKERQGKIVDVKFDDEKKRWYVKINDGKSDQPSGQSGGQGGYGPDDEDTFKSDWLPWQSFSHGTIKMSVPPKKGQHALMRSPGGAPEQAVAEPYHYAPENPSPHDKQDEIVKLIEDDEDEQQQGQGGAGQGGQQGQQQDKYHSWEHETKQSHHLIIQKKKQQDGQQATTTPTQSTDSGGAFKNDDQQKPQKERKLPTVEEDGDDDTLQVKATKDGWLLTFLKKKVKIKANKDALNMKFGDKKADINLTDNDLVMKFGDNKSTITMTNDKVEIKQSQSVYTQTADEFEFKVGNNSVVVNSQGVFLVGKTYVGVDHKGDKPENKLKDIADTPAKQAFVKVE